MERAGVCFRASPRSRWWSRGRGSRCRLETARSTHRAAQESVAALEPQLELAQAELDRAQSLYEKRAISVQQLERTRAQTRRIEGEHRMAVAELEESIAGVDEARVERARLDVLDREADKLGHGETELRGRIEQQRLDVADRTIASPVDGVMDRTFAQVGEYVRPGQRLAIVHDPKRVWIEANVKETQIRKLVVGQPVEVRVDAYPGEVFHGRVRTIGSATTGSFALLERRTEFHVDAMAATQGAGNVAMREMLNHARDLLVPSGLPETIHDLVALDHLGRMIEAQASTNAYQDGFVLVTCVFVLALPSTWLIGWLDRRRRIG